MMLSSRGYAVALDTDARAAKPVADGPRVATKGHPWNARPLPDLQTTLKSYAKLFDLGALTVTDDHRVAVSGHFRGGSPSSDVLVHALDGRPLIEPIAGRARVAGVHAAWHREQVFKEPARSAA